MYLYCSNSRGEGNERLPAVPRAILLPRDVMHKRGLCRHAVSVCPSVHLFVTFVDSVETSKPIFKIVSRSGSHTTLVIPHHTSWKYSDGNPLTGASNAGWVGKNIAIFDKYLAIGSMTAAVSEQQLWRSTVQFTAQTAMHQWILFITISMDDHNEEKRTAHNVSMQR